VYCSSKDLEPHQIYFVLSLMSCKQHLYCGMKNNNESVALKCCYLTRVSHLFAFMLPNIQIFAPWNMIQLWELQLFCEFQDIRYYDWTGYNIINLNLSNVHLMRFTYVYYLYLSPLKLWIQTQFMARATRCNIMW
jgi:hypothetical protein